MGLDVNFITKQDVICPHCGKVVDTKIICIEDSNGRGWYPLLERIGYYTSDNRWYGKDMVLTEDQKRLVYDFVRNHLDLHRAHSILGAIAQTVVEKSVLVVNADW